MWRETCELAFIVAETKQTKKGVCEGVEYTFSIDSLGSRIMFVRKEESTAAV